MNPSAYNISQLREENQNDAIKTYQKRIEQLNKRNSELKKKHNGLKDDFQYNYGLLRERDEELDKLEKAIDSKDKVLLSLTKTIENYKQQIKTEKFAHIKNQQLLNKSNENIEIIKKEYEIKLNDIKFEYIQKLESTQKQNQQQIIQIKQLKELIQRLKSQNVTEKASNNQISQKYEKKLDDLVSKLSKVQHQFEIEKKTNKTRINEYIKTIREKDGYCKKLEKDLNDLNLNVSTKQSETNDLYYRLQEREKQLNEIKLELNNSRSCNNKLNNKETKIQRLEFDLQKMYESQCCINKEKNELNTKLLISNKEIQKLNKKIEILNNEIINKQQNNKNIMNELSENNEILKKENNILRQQNKEIKNVTFDMKSAIKQLHSLTNLDKNYHGMDINEMQILIDENEKLKKQINLLKSTLKEKERELIIIKKEKLHLNEISNRYHHQLNSQKYNINKYYDDNHSDSDDYDENIDTYTQDSDHEINLKKQNDKLLRKIKELQLSTSHITTNTTKGRSKTNIKPLSKSATSIRTKYDKVRRKLNAGMNDNKSRIRSKQYSVRNWNQR